MFRRKSTEPQEDPVRPRDILGFIGEGNSLTGDLVLNGGFRVDGRIQGRISSSSTLIVGPPGVVESEELKVQSLSVSGIVRGRLEVQERLEIRRGGRVCGEVALGRPGLFMEPGAILEATVTMGQERDEPRAEPDLQADAG